MKLVFVNRFFHPDHSATSQILGDLAFDLAAEGWNVHVVTSRQLYEDAKANLARRETVRAVQVHRAWSTRFGRGNTLGRALDYGTFYLGTAWTLLGILSSGDVVVAKTDPPLISVVAAWVARRRGAALVNWLQDVFPEIAIRLGMRSVKGLPGRVATRLRNYSLREAAANIAVGERMGEYVRKLGIEAAKVHVIENWSDSSLVRPVPRESNPLRTQWGLQGRFVVGYSGNLGRAHEFRTILDACRLLREDKAIAFLFIGGGRQLDSVREAVREQSLENVSFAPYQPRERLGQSLSAADAHLVTLQPSLEGFIVPSKFYGIAAAGRPTLFVGDKDGEVARLVERYGCGIAVATGDAAGLAAAIVKMKEGAAEAMGRAALEAFARSHDRPQAARRWSTVLRGLRPSTSA